MKGKGKEKGLKASHEKKLKVEDQPKGKESQDHHINEPHQEASINKTGVSGAALTSYGWELCSSLASSIAWLPSKNRAQPSLSFPSRNWARVIATHQLSFTI